MKFKIEALGAAALVVLSGDIDDDIDSVLTAVAKASAGKDLILDCHGVGKINSIGVKGWINSVQRWSKNRQVSFKNCHHNFIDMAVMVPAFVEGCKILSLEVAFACEDCGRERVLVVEVKDQVIVMPKDLVCPKCAGKLASQDLEADLEFVVERN